MITMKRNIKIILHFPFFLPRYFGSSGMQSYSTDNTLKLFPIKFSLLPLCPRENLVNANPSVFFIFLHWPFFLSFSLNLVKQQTIVQGRDLLCCLRPIRWHRSISAGPSIPNLNVTMFWVFSSHKSYASFQVSWILSMGRLLWRDLSSNSTSFDEASSAPKKSFSINLMFLSSFSISFFNIF